MNPLAALFTAAPRASAALERDWLLRPIGSAATAAGTTISVSGAEGIGVIYACARILGETVAQLPFKLLEQTPRGQVPATTHHTYTLLHDLGNPEMTAFEVWDTLTVQRALWGYSFAEIERDSDGRAIALWPLLSAQMGRITRMAGNRVVYPYLLPNGETHTFVWHRGASTPAKRLPPLLHLKLNATDGLNGRSPVLLHRESLGLTKAAEEYSARFYANSGITAGTFLKVPGALKPDVRANLEAQLNEARGLSNAHRIKILEGGFDVATVGVPPQVAESNEARAFQLEEGARIYRIQLHLLQHMTKSTSWGSGIEQLGLAFLTYTMMPWLVSTQQAVWRDVLIPEDRARYQPKFIVNALVRGDMKSRYDAYVQARQNGILDGNEIRELEELNTREDAGELWMPANMMPVAASGWAPVVEDDRTRGRLM